MPPTLDLSRTAHSKMIISPPRINLRRAASYNYDKGPLSSTSSRFSFNHLVFSPPPSPGLPSLSPPPRKPPKGFTGIVRPRRVARIVLTALALFLLFRGLVWISDSSVLQWATGGQYTRVDAEGRESLPGFPTPITVTDKGGRRSKWTVSIPPGHAFPLSIGEYANMCAKCREISDKIHEEQTQDHSLQSSLLDFRSDRGFVDVQEAQKKGFLPGGSGSKTQKSALPTCVKSLTVVLESTDAGIGSALLMLWTAYGLAKKEGRSFFIDDTRWAYGKYSDIFQTPPSPGCSAPPDHERIPCPRQARHLVVTSATFPEIYTDLTFGHDDPQEPLALSNQKKSAFALARTGHDALFRLNEDDAQYVDRRVRDLLGKRIVPKTKGRQNGAAIGVHIRRGDRHPLEFQYRDSYIPLDKYTGAAQKLVESHSGDVAARDQSFFVVASDDPTVYESGELTSSYARITTYPAQDRIRLASKQAIQDANPPDKHVMHKFVDEAFGWEGGFFSAMFWNLGMGSAARANEKTNAVNMARAGAGAGAGAAAPLTAETESGSSSSPAVASELVPPPPSAETIRLRSLVGRAYMMDLAVLADVSDAVVCSVSAFGCRLLAVMLGWESAFEKGNWVNVDGGYGWLGV